MGLSARLHRRRERRCQELVLKLPPYRILSFDTLGSTNDEAMARLKAGDRGGLVVTARRQSGGRGRQGRAWASPPGNLYASLGLVDPAPRQLAPQLGFVAGVALCDTLRARLRGDVRLEIKWPNDIVHEGAKLAGMLLESTILPGGAFGCVVGIGVNCISHPDGLPYPATDLARAGDPAPDVQVLLADLGEAIARWLDAWQRGAGFPLIREAWLARAAGVGGRIKVALPARPPLFGTFVGLDQSGRLLLDMGERHMVIDAGDVFLPGLVAGAMEA